MLLIHLQILCIVIAAFTSEITFGSADVDQSGRSICYANPKAEISGSRICLSLVATAISSIMVCMMLIIFDVLVPCVDTMVKIMIHIAIVISL